MEPYAPVGKTIRPLSFLILLLVAAVLPKVSPGLSAQDVPAYTPEQLSEMAGELRHHYYERAWELCWMQGLPSKI